MPSGWSLVNTIDDYQSFQGTWGASQLLTSYQTGDSYYTIYQYNGAPSAHTYSICSMYSSSSCVDIKTTSDGKYYIQLGSSWSGTTNFKILIRRQLP